MENDAFQPVDGPGPPQESIGKVTEGVRRLRQQQFFRAFVQPLGFREENMVHSDQYCFSYHASAELERNVPAAACLACLQSRCTRTAHQSKD